MLLNVNLFQLEHIFTEYEVNGSGANPIGPAPSLDGVYRSMGGDSNYYYFFDAQTGALISLNGLNYIVSDQPMTIDAPKITVKKK